MVDGVPQATAPRTRTSDDPRRHHSAREAASALRNRPGVPGQVAVRRRLGNGGLLSAQCSVLNMPHTDRPLTDTPSRRPSAAFQFLNSIVDTYSRDSGVVRSDLHSITQILLPTY